jgi:hypothetical protein
MAGHADAEARRSVLTALQCATLVALTVLYVPNRRTCGYNLFAQGYLAYKKPPTFLGPP